MAEQYVVFEGGHGDVELFVGFGSQAQRLRQECGTVSAIAGILKTPLDILGDKLRCYVGLTMNLHERPQQVVRACEARYWSVSGLLLMTADQPT